MTDRELTQRITDYLTGGGLFNPEMGNHEAVRELLIDCRDALAQPKQEPVAWINAKESFCGFPRLVISEKYKKGFSPVYTAPPISEPVKERISKPLANQEPVAYFWRDTKQCYWVGHGSPKIDFKDLANLGVQPLYTAPPKPWVGLTVEEIKEILYGLLEDDRTPMLTVIDAVQEKLKEKNNG